MHPRVYIETSIPSFYHEMMKTDPAIDQIRKTRREISQKYGHDTRALIAHYRSLETKYADRIVKESVAEYSTK